MIDRNDFIEKCQAVMHVIQGMGIHVSVSHDALATWFRYDSYTHNKTMFIYNGDKEVIMCHNLDLKVRIKESKDYLEVA